MGVTPRPSFRTRASSLTCFGGLSFSLGQKLGPFLDPVTSRSAARNGHERSELRPGDHFEILVAAPSPV
jgi:hypothetical protein